MPTVKELKQYIRDHKQKNCPAFSRLKKAELIQLASKLGYIEDPTSGKKRGTADYVNYYDKRQVGKTNEDGWQLDSPFADEKTYMKQQAEYKRAMKKNPDQYLLVTKSGDKATKPHYRKIKSKYYRARKRIGEEIKYWANVQALWNIINVDSPFLNKTIDYDEVMRRSGVKDPEKLKKEFDELPLWINEALHRSPPGKALKLW